METKSLCILGAARNVADFLPQVLANFSAIASWWKNCKMVVFENDSTDSTSVLLHEWKASGGDIDIVQEVNLEDRFPNRTERLAYIRNRLLHYVPPSFDYVFMVDMDDVFSNPVQKSSFESCFTVPSWDVMVGIGRTEYYDTWALRVPGVIEGDCWENFYRLRGLGKTMYEATQEAIITYNSYMTSLKDVSPVHSAFNIGALFKVSAIHSCCRYSGKYPNGKEACEHVSFNTCLRSHGGQILFNPKFIL